jgi:hypothetical protein
MRADPSQSPNENEKKSPSAPQKNKGGPFCPREKQRKKELIS